MGYSPEENKFPGDWTNKRAMKIKRLEHQSNEKLSEPGLFSLEKVQGDLFNVYKT